jgi:nudix-type nucleoside diphosphatase (YffH/AdpP family)
MAIEFTHIDKVHDGSAKLLVATVRLTSGEIAKRDIEDHGPAVSVLPYNAEKRTAILVRQFRAAVFLVSRQEELLEAIAGMNEDSHAIECARREAFEEAGLKLDQCEHVLCGWTMPGISTERMDLYLAPYTEADRIGPGGGADGEQEDITIVEMGLSELADMADKGLLTDIKTFALVQTLRLRRPDLFTP